MPNITLPDGSVRSFEQPVTIAQVAASIGAGLARAALAGKVEGVLSTPPISSSTTPAGDRHRQGCRRPRGHPPLHGAPAGLCGQGAVPDAQVTIGPVIDNGFYYDFSYKRPFTPEDLAKIEARMGELAKRDIPVERSVLPRDEAVAYFKSIGEHYKAEIIASIPQGEDVSLYREGDFTDLCRGPTCRPPAS
jgi:threonyl-tRNA synthetase